MPFTTKHSRIRSPARIGLWLALICSTADGAVWKEVPLKDLPSREGPHIAQIKQMPEDSWLDLGAPAPDPECGPAVGRSWSSKMAYAADLRGAFLTGEGRHGASTVRNGKRHYNDDVLFYDINAHRWVCVYPGLELGKYNAKLNEHGLEVDENGHPLPIAWMVHAYNGVTYDPDRREFLTLHNPSGGGYWRKSMPERVAFLKRSKIRRPPGLSPWIYRVDKGHWDRRPTAQRAPRMGHGGHLIYLPWLKQHFFMFKQAYLYDPAKNAWLALSPRGPVPPRPIDAASCLDRKRKRVYIAMGSYGPVKQVKGEGNRLWAYDVDKNLWIDLRAKGELPSRQAPTQGTNVSTMHCNSVEDTVLFFAMEGRDKGIYAYAPDANEWTRISSEFPEGWREKWRNHSHAFYDPELNVHFFFEAGDSRANGKMRVYRFKDANRD